MAITRALIAIATVSVSLGAQQPSAPIQPPRSGAGSTAGRPRGPSRSCAEQHRHVRRSDRAMRLWLQFRRRAGLGERRRTAVQRCPGQHDLQEHGRTNDGVQKTQRLCRQRPKARTASRLAVMERCSISRRGRLSIGSSSMSLALVPAAGRWEQLGVDLTHVFAPWVRY